MPIQAEPNLIVVVMSPEDEDADLIKSTLERAGFQIAFCGSEAEAEELCRPGQEPVRLLIADPAAADARVSEFLSHYPDTPMLALVSRNHTPEQISNLPFPGNVRVRLKKPFRRTRVLGSVLEALDQPLVRTA